MCSALNLTMVRSKTDNVCACLKLWLWCLSVHSFWFSCADVCVLVSPMDDHLYASPSPGSHVYVDGMKIVDNGGLHAANEIKTGSVSLTRGYHFFKVSYFENGGEQVLEIKYKGPDTFDKETAIAGYHFASVMPGAKGKLWYLDSDVDKFPKEVADGTLKNNNVIRSDSVAFRNAREFRQGAPDFPSENVAGVWKGDFEVVQGGKYRFFLRSRGGSHLWIDGIEIVNNGGRHGAKTKRGSMELASGIHAFEVRYWNNQNPMLVLKYQGPDTKRRRKTMEPVSFSSDANAVRLLPGLQAAVYYYPDKLTSMPSVLATVPSHIVTADSLNFRSKFDWRAMTKDWPEESSVAVIFTGVFMIAKAGLYSFSCTSAGGSHVWIDGNLIIDNGGEHSDLEVRGSVELMGGYHMFKADYYRSVGMTQDPKLILTYFGPDTDSDYKRLKGVHFAPLPSPAVPAQIVEGSGWCTKWFFAPAGSDEIRVMPRFRRSIPQKVEIVHNLDYHGIDVFKAVSEVSAERLAVQFSGEHVFEKSGMYKLCLTASNHANLKMNGQWAVRLRTQDGEMMTKCKNRYMSERRYLFTVEYFENGRDPQLKFTYEGPETDGKKAIMTSSGYKKETCAIEAPTCECGKGWCSLWFFNPKGPQMLEDFADVRDIDAQFARRIGRLSLIGKRDFKRVLRGVDHVPVTAVAFSGFIYIMKPGEYTICTDSSDGSKVEFDAATIVEAPGVHNAGKKEKRCSAVGLNAGAYATNVTYFQNAQRNPKLRVTYSGPDTNGKEQPMPSSWHSIDKCGADPNMPVFDHTPPAPTQVTQTEPLEIEGPAKPDELILNYYCRRYLDSVGPPATANSRKQQRYLRKCRGQDCQQAKERTGCHYMSSEGFCWTDSGQHFCAKPENKESAFCKTSVSEPLHAICEGQGEIAQWERDVMHSGAEEPDMSDVSLPEMPTTVNYYCNKYYKWVEKAEKQGKLDKYEVSIQRKLDRCRRQDCRQAQEGRETCTYVNEDGFCYIAPGQQYCDMNQADPRCFTKDAKPPKQWLHEVCPGPVEVETEEKDDKRNGGEATWPRGKAHQINMFRVNSFCERYEKRNRARDLRRCQRQDCTQEMRSLGCAFVSKEGYCYRRNGQRFCKDNPTNENCFTREQITNPKRATCPKKAVQLRINSNCQRYKLRNRPRFLKRCTRQDCVQAKSDIGCQYVNEDGFCYTGPGQKYCAESFKSRASRRLLLKSEDEDAGGGDPRCLTEVESPLHPVCKTGEPIPPESKLPPPADVGLVPGLRVRFYYIGEQMTSMPNVRSRVPNWIAEAEELHFEDEAAFKKLDPKKPDDLWAAVIDGVLAVEEQGAHEFFLSSDDGSHLWIDGKLLISNGGLHGAEEIKSASIVLDPGYHAIKVDLFDNEHAAALTLLWKGPTTDGKKDYVNGYYFKNSEPGAQSKNVLPSPEDVGLTQGFLMSVYTSNMPDPLVQVPHLDAMKPDFTGRSKTIQFHGMDSFRKVYSQIPDDHFAIEWQGVIPVTQDGEYKFYLNSDDGSHLWVDGKMLVDNGGLHNADETKEGVVELTRGYHTIKVDFFENQGMATMNCKWSGPGIVREQYIEGYHFSKEVLKASQEDKQQGGQQEAATGLWVGEYWVLPEDMTDKIENLPDFATLGEPKTVIKSEVLDLDHNKFEALGFKDGFAARWTGEMEVKTPGAYLFYLTSDDGSRIYVNNVLTVDNDGLHGPREKTGTIDLESGKFPVVVDFFEKRGGADVVVKYSGPDTGGTPVLLRVSEAVIPVTVAEESPPVQEESAPSPVPEVPAAPETESPLVADETASPSVPDAPAASPVVAPVSSPIVVQDYDPKTGKTFSGPDIHGRYNKDKWEGPTEDPFGWRKEASRKQGQESADYKKAHQVFQRQGDTGYINAIQQGSRTSKRKSDDLTDADWKGKLPPLAYRDNHWFKKPKWQGDRHTGEEVEEREYTHRVLPPAKKSLYPEPEKVPIPGVLPTLSPLKAKYKAIGDAQKLSAVNPALQNTFVTDRQALRS